MDPEKTFHAEVIRPNGVVFDGEVSLVSFPAHDGERAVLHGHAAFLCLLGTGTMRIHAKNNKSHYFWLDGGMAEVNSEGKLYFLPNAIVEAGKIDLIETKEKLQKIIEHKTDKNYTTEQKEREIILTRTMIKAAEKVN